MSFKRRQLTDADRYCVVCRGLTGYFLAVAGRNKIVLRCQGCKRTWRRYECVTPVNRAQHERDLATTKNRIARAALAKAQPAGVAQ